MDGRNFESNRANFDKGASSYKEVDIRKLAIPTSFASSRLRFLEAVSTLS